MCSNTTKGVVHRQTGSRQTDKCTWCTHMLETATHYTNTSDVDPPSRKAGSIGHTQCPLCRQPIPPRDAYTNSHKTTTLSLATHEAPETPCWLAAVSQQQHNKCVEQCWGPRATGRIFATISPHKVKATSCRHTDMQQQQQHTLSTQGAQGALLVAPQPPCASNTPTNQRPHPHGRCAVQRVQQT